MGNGRCIRTRELRRREIMSIDKSILLDAHNIVYKNADGHDYGSFDQNMQDALSLIHI